MSLSRRGLRKLGDEWIVLVSNPAKTALFVHPDGEIRLGPCAGRQAHRFRDEVLTDDQRSTLRRLQECQ